MARDKEKQRVYSAAWRKANKEKIRARDAAWRKAHPEERKARCAAWRKAHPEKTREYNVAWYKAHQAEDKVRSTAWYEAHPEAIKINSHTRRARKTAVGGKLSKGISEKLLLRQKNKCAICKKSVKKTGYHLDHIMPLALGGKNEDGNIQILCPTCNLQKNSRHPISHMQSLGYLL